MSDQKISLIEFYEKVLDAIFHHSPDGKAIMTGNASLSSTDVAKVAGRTLMMPASELLRNPEDDKIYFHPLSEKLTRGESTVFRYIRRMGLIRISTALSSLGQGLLRIQEHPEVQRAMSADKQQFFAGIVDTDKNSGTAWVKMNVAAIQADPSRTDTWPVHIYMRNNGTYGGKNLRRVGITTFPAFNFIAAGERYKKGTGAEEKILFRPKDYLMYQQVMEAIFGPISKVEEDEVYNSGYNGTLAPYLIAYIRTYLQIARRINEVIDLFKNEFLAVGSDTFEAFRLPMDLEYYVSTDEGLAELEALARRVPALAGNIGSTDGKDELEESAGEGETSDAPVQRANPAAPKAEPARKADPAPAKVEATKPAAPAVNPEHARILAEAAEKRRLFLENEAHEEKLRKEREERYAERREPEPERRPRPRDEERPRDNRRDERRDDRRDPPWEEDKPAEVANGKKRFGGGAFAGEDRRDRRDDRDYRDRDGYRGERGGYRGDRRDDYYDRRDDEYYDRGRGGYRGDDRGYGRGGYRGDDYGYRGDSRDRGYSRGRGVSRPRF